MGRQSRKKAEQRALRARARTALKVTVVTHPDASFGPAELAEDLALVKSAVLYADDVELVSLRASLSRFAHSVSSAAAGPASEFSYKADDSFLRRGLAGTLPPDFQAPFDETIAGARIPRDLPLPEFRVRWRAAVRQTQAETLARRDETAKERGYYDIARLEAIGLVTLASSGLDQGWTIESWAPRWWEIIRDRIEDGTHRLLFDTASENLVVNALRRELVQPGKLFSARAGETHAGAGLIARLPAFPNAPLDELLALRSDLSDPLGRYRRAVAKMARNSDVGVGPEAREKVETLWLDDVEPAIQEIRDLMAEHTIVRELATSAEADLKSFLTEGAALALGLSTFTNVGEMVTAAAAAGTPAVHAAYSAWLKSSKARRDASKHDMFYLYEADRRFPRTSQE